MRQRSVEAPRLWQKMATQTLADVEEEWVNKRMCVLLDFEDERAHQICSFMWADNFWITSHSKENLEQMLRDLIEEAAKWDSVPKLASLWWTSSYEAVEKIDMFLITAAGCHKFPLRSSSRS